MSGRSRWAGTAGVAAAVAALPFARGMLRGESLYFRDLAGQFLPLRRFVVAGLRVGELRFWNPYANEGVPLAQLPISYPFDLLQVWLSGYPGISLTLAFHIPAAAIAFVLLGRSFGLAPCAALAGGLIYALGGFALSTLNLYIYVKTLAWAPIVVLAMRRAADRGPRSVAGLALVAAIGLSTIGVEVFAQTVLIGLVLSFPPVDWRRGARLLVGLALAAALCAPTVLVLRDLTERSARAGGFPADVTLSQSIHPLTWLQVAIADFHGELDDMVNRWWGDNFFPQGFPYILSLYLGASALALAAVGGLVGGGPRRRLLALTLLAVLVALGRYVGWRPLVEALPLVRHFRYPAKVFFTVHFCAALLAALGVDALLREGARRRWRLLSLLTLGAGALLSSCLVLPRLFPRTTLWFVAGFFPPRLALAQRYADLGTMASSAAAGGVVALGVAALAWLVWRGRLRPALGAAAVTALVAADLLRAGAGLNPTVTASFFETSPETTAEAAALRQAGARIFTCHVPQSSAYLRRRAQLSGRHEFFTFALMRETLSPNTNVEHRVPSALSIDLTMLVPPGQVLEPEEAGCHDLPALLPRLRRAAVTHVLSLDPLSDPALRLEATVAPPGIAPLVVHVYALADPLPFAALGAGTPVVARAPSPGSFELSVDSVNADDLVIREGYGRGWQARVNDRPTPVRRVEDHHMAVAVPAGHSEVVLDYRPPSLRLGLAIAGLAALAVLLLLSPGLLKRLLPGRGR